MSSLALRNPLGKYWEIARINYRESSAHASNILGSSFIVLFRVWIFTQLYSVTYRVAGSQTVGGFTLPMVIWSLMMVQSFQAATRPSVSKIMMEEIQDGTVAYSLNRPYSYMLFHYCAFIGRCLPKLALSLVIGGLAAYVLVGRVAVQPAGIIGGGILLFFGYTLGFFIDFCIGLCSFWLENVEPLYWIYSKAQLVFGGLIVPLTLFPASVQRIAEYLPFSQLYYGAARQVVGFNVHTFEKFLLIQLAYMLVLFLFSRYLFGRAIRLVTVNGG